MEGKLKQLTTIALFVSASTMGQTSPLPEAKLKIEYKSVPEALAGLRAKPGTEFSVQNSWTIVVEPTLNVIWSFSPEGHPTYPSVVKRSVVERNGKTFIDMDVMCRGTKLACDTMVREFIDLSQKTSAHAESQN
jgi:hypothetical protein